MTRELFWLTLTVILTGLLWVPYILNRCQVRGLGGAMANPSRNDKPHAEWATRLMFAHDNAVENLVIFAPLVLILSAIDYSTQMDGAGLRGVFLGPRRASDRLHDGPAGVPHAGLHRRLPRAGRAGAGDFQGLDLVSRSWNIGPKVARSFRRPQARRDDQQVVTGRRRAWLLRAPNWTCDRSADNVGASRQDVGTCATWPASRTSSDAVRATTSIAPVVEAGYVRYSECTRRLARCVSQSGRLFAAVFVRHARRRRRCRQASARAVSASALARVRGPGRAADRHWPRRRHRPRYSSQFMKQHRFDRTAETARRHRGHFRRSVGGANRKAARQHFGGILARAASEFEDRTAGGNSARKPDSRVRLVPRARHRLARCRDRTAVRHRPRPRRNPLTLFRRRQSPASAACSAPPRLKRPCRDCRGARPAPPDGVVAGKHIELELVGLVERLGLDPAALGRRDCRAASPRHRCCRRNASPARRAGRPPSGLPGSVSRCSGTDTSMPCR